MPPGKPGIDDGLEVRARLDPVLTDHRVVARIAQVALALRVQPRPADGEDIDIAGPIDVAGVPQIPISVMPLGTAYTGKPSLAGGVAGTEQVPLIAR